MAIIVGCLVVVVVAIVVVVTLGGVTVLLGSMLGVVGGAAIAVANILARVWSTCICWEPISADGVAGAGCWRALVKAAAASRAAAMEDVLGIGLLCGKNSTVSATRSAAVLVTYTR